MKTMELGTQGLTVPVIGLGCMGMTGFEKGNMYGPADEKEAIATIHRSLELGGNFLDTADLYGPFREMNNLLSAEEEDNLITILNKIDKECQHIDKHTQEIILSQIELLLNYSNRFYERQFITRKNHNNQLLARFEQIISEYFGTDTSSRKGLLTVQYIASQMNISANYLSDLLRIHTGQNTQQHIHHSRARRHVARLDPMFAIH